jgi:hypothetical protein
MLSGVYGSTIALADREQSTAVASYCIAEFAEEFRPQRRHKGSFVDAVNQ